MSLFNNASAGEFAAFTLIAAGAGYLEVALMTLVTNARYLLMSCALSQKFAPSVPVHHRMLVGFDVTDEIFGVNMAVPGMLCPWYTYGVIIPSLLGWSGGTGLGVVMGNVLPASLTSALSVALFGMFLAVIIPPARKSRVLAVLIGVSMAASFVLSKLQPFASLSSGMRVIILTVLLSGIAAYLFPVSDAESEGDEHAA